jgi:uncharacterized membrane protein YgdD (TMEM256/DUF423 family)
MSHPLLTLAALLGGLAVAAGSFGAHGLKERLEAAGQSANWETAVRYALFHAVATLVVAVAAASPGFSAGRGWLTAAGWCFLAGSAIFSGFLLALALSGVRILGAIVPIGGVLLIAGWILLAVAGLRR